MGITDWFKPKVPGPWPFTMPVRNVEFYRRLLVEDAKLDEPKLLREWRWLFDESYRPILATTCGGLFLERDGAIYWLDDAMGELVRVAASRAEFESAACTIDNFDLWFKPYMLHKARRAHRPLRPGECFSYTSPPAIGGKYEPRNLGPTPLWLHLQIHGQLHRQLQQLAKGTRIGKFNVERTSDGVKITVETISPSAPRS